MKVGDLVRFVDKGTYAKWFYGQMAVVKSYVAKGADGKSHCRVKWLTPVKYFDKYTSVSDFGTDKFKVLK